MKTEPVKILVKECAEPHAVTTACRVPLPILQKVKEELSRMKTMGVIKKVTYPTDLCSPMVPVVNSKGKVPICMDIQKGK